MIKSVVVTAALAALSVNGHNEDFASAARTLDMNFDVFTLNLVEGSFLCNGADYTFTSSQEAFDVQTEIGSFGMKKKPEGLGIALRNGLANSRMAQTFEFVVPEETKSRTLGSETNVAEDLLSTEFGYCVVELFLKFGQIGIIGKDTPALEPLMHFGKMIYAKGQQEEYKAWDHGALERHLEASNNNIRALKNLRTVDARQLLNCRTNQWFRLGDGRCDEQFNNADCNYDNGDCCRSTCKNYRAAWGTRSPPDDDGNRHPVYDCSTATSATCRALCSPGVTGYGCVSGSEGMCFRNYCGNEYFGMCGAGSGCATSLCGNCYCHFECQAHDKFCSCDGLFSFGCLNVFRSWCD